MRWYCNQLHSDSTEFILSSFRFINMSKLHHMKQKHAESLRTWINMAVQEEMQNICNVKCQNLRWIFNLYELWRAGRQKYCRSLIAVLFFFPRWLLFLIIIHETVNEGKVIQLRRWRVFFFSVEYNLISTIPFPPVLCYMPVQFTERLENWWLNSDDENNVSTTRSQVEAQHGKHNLSSPFRTALEV